MTITILGAESLGARSLCVLVKTSWGTVLVDPGVALSPHRFSKPPHPLELAAARLSRKKITEAAAHTHTIVITHYHFDHYTPFIPRMYGFSDEKTAEQLYKGKHLLVKARSHHINYSQKKRSYHFFRQKNLSPKEVDGETGNRLSFSPPFFHGEPNSKRGYVIMGLVRDGQDSVVCASDIQCLSSPPVDWILENKPSTVVLSGPPVYLRAISDDQKSFAQDQLARLSQQVPTVIVDHHLTRDRAFADYLLPVRQSADNSGHQVLTAAEYLGQPNRLLEARREELYDTYPVQNDWFKRFAERDPEILADLDQWEHQLQLME
jgi:predicted metallo-beta-lactamase superfamily hydrolase